jgi:hypothetical protein
MHFGRSGVVWAVMAWPALWGAGCADDSSGSRVTPTEFSEAGYAPYSERQVAVVGTADESGSVVRGSADLGQDDCLVVGEQCIPAKRLGCDRSSGPADVVVRHGQIAYVVCYGDTNAPTRLITSEGGAVQVPKNASNAVLVFDPATNGVPIEGDVVIDGNNVTLYGNGPDQTIIQGNLIITGNNARVRGITVLGNVVIDKNNTSLVLTRVEGNVILNLNNALVAGCEIFGNLQASFNNHVLIDNGIAGNLELTGNNYTCSGNFRIDDANSNKRVDENERGDSLSCSSL